MAEKQQYAVTAPLVIARDTEGASHHVYRLGLLPEDVDQAQLEQLLKQGMVAEVKAEAEAKPKAK